MKSWRLIYYGAIIFWLFAGMATGQRIFFVLLFIQSILAIMALIMNLWAAFSFTYLQELSTEKTLHGRMVELKLKVYNEQLLPYPMMKIRLTTPAYRDNPELNFNLAANHHLDFDLKLNCPYRGLYEVGMTVIDFIDIFGLVRLPFNMKLLPYYRMPKLLVYPQLDELGSLPLVTRDSKTFSRHRFSTEDQTEPFSTVRAYRRGDSRKLIHWKATARQQKLLTRQFEQATEPGLLLAIDLNRPLWQHEAGLQAIDALCETATAVIHYLLRQGWHLYLASNDEQVSANINYGMKDFARLYNWLAKVDFADDVDFSGLLEEALARHPDVKAVLVLTTRVNSRLSSVLVRRNRSGRPIYMIAAAPAGPDKADTTTIKQLRQAGLPVWQIRYGQKPGDILSGERS